MIREKISSEKEAHYLKKKKNAKLAMAAKSEAVPKSSSSFLVEIGPT